MRLQKETIYTGVYRGFRVNFFNTEAGWEMKIEHCESGNGINDQLPFNQSTIDAFNETTEEFLSKVAMQTIDELIEEDLSAISGI